VAHKTLAPVWNELFRFEVNDSTLQSEPVEFRVMDRDVYSSDDPVKQPPPGSNCHNRNRRLYSPQSV